MQSRQRMLQFYKSGRYACDLNFHLQLQSALKELNLYHLLPVLEKQIQVVRSITHLTEINSKSLEDDYDDDEGLFQTQRIRSMLAGLDTAHIGSMLDECHAMGWQSYEQKALNFLKPHALYHPIAQRITATIHSEEFRCESLIFLAFFEYLHGDEVTKVTQMYAQTVEHFLDLLNGHRRTIEVIADGDQFSNISKLTKVRAFVGTLFAILKTCLRFCEILKILTGKNNLSLKFTVIKKEIEKLVSSHSQWNLSQQKQQFFSSQTPFKEYLKDPKRHLPKETICKWCFKSLSKSTNQHAFCWQLIGKKDQFPITK